MSTIYVCPTGSGTNSGASATNALPFASLDKAIQLAGAGGTVLMLADKGSYKISSSITLSHGGSSSAPVTIKGIDSAGHAMNVQISGDRPSTYSPDNPAGTELFRMMDGANNLKFQNMTISNVSSAFRVAAELHGITVQDVAAKNVQYFFQTYVGGTNTDATVSGLLIKNVTVTGFSKGAIRLQYDSHDVVIDNVKGDSLREDGDGIAIGIHLEGTAHDILIKNTEMANCQAAGGDYWNGDGFATERGVYAVTFQDTVSKGNADAGYDLKSASTTLIRAVAQDNARNFRIWGDVTMTDPVGLDPHKRGGSVGAQIQVEIMDGAKARITGGSFADSGSDTKVVLDHGTGTVTFSNTLFAHAANGALSYGTNITGLLTSLVKGVTATGDHSTNGGALLDSLPDRAPDALTLSNTRVSENSPAGTVVGKVTGHDSDVGETLRYSLVKDGAGAFHIDPVTGVISTTTTASLDYEKAQSYQLTVRVTDSGGLSFDKAVSIQVANVAETHSVSGTSGDDTIAARSDDKWQMSGLAGNDYITTKNGADTVDAGSGSDVISTSGGNDVLTGGSGKDLLTGGSGNDRFDFNAISDSPAGSANADRITDFTQGTDIIDLSSIDAKANVSGDQAFTFLGTGAFTGSAGQVRFNDSDSSVTHVYVDIDGNRTADFELLLTGYHKLVSSDFLF